MKMEKWMIILTVAGALNLLAATAWGNAGLLHNPGDVTEDGFVGSDDLIQVLTNWGATGPQVTWEMGDCAPYYGGINPGDDFIGSDDYVEVLTYWGTPEPATLGVLALGALAALIRRR